MLEAAQVIAWLTAGLLVAGIVASARLIARIACIPGAGRTGSDMRGVSAFRLLVGAASLGALATCLAVASNFF